MVIAGLRIGEKLREGGKQQNMKPLHREGDCSPDRDGAVLESAWLACIRLWIQSKHHKENKTRLHSGRFPLFRKAERIVLPFGLLDSRRTLHLIECQKDIISFFF